MSYWLQDWSWQVSWVRGARWRWVSLVLHDLPMPSRKPSYRKPVSFLGEALGSALWIPCPSVGTSWRVRSRVTEQYCLIMASSSSNTLSTSICNENERVDCHYVVQSVDSDHPVSKLSPFVLDKAVRSAVASVKTLRRLRNGDFLLEVASAVQSRIVSKLDNLAGFLLQPALTGLSIPARESSGVAHLLTVIRRKF